MIFLFEITSLPLVKKARLGVVLLARWEGRSFVRYVHGNALMVVAVIAFCWSVRVGSARERGARIHGLSTLLSKTYNAVGPGVNKAGCT